MSREPPILLDPFETQILGREDDVREGLRQIVGKLAPLNLGREQAITIELVLAEAMNNIIEHAYPSPNQTGNILLHCRHAADGLHICIKDQGLPMPCDQPPLCIGKLQEIAMRDLPESGFGLYLIHDLAQDVRYLRNGTENRLDLRLAITLPG